MGYAYSYTTGQGEALASMIGALLGGIPAAAVAIGLYVLSALALYTIAKRRELNHAWLSWLPIGEDWILGSISDQARYVTRGEVRSKRKILLALNILQTVMQLILWVAVVSMAATMMGLVFSGREDAIPRELFSALARYRWMVLPSTAISICLMVIRYMALYDLYGSCDPANKTVFLILGIVFRFLEPLFLFLCRQKDLGMPPRKPTPPPSCDYSYQNYQY